ncbi:MAG: hypothetical protein R2724_08820 [Bryobacterales bacterium]
MSLEKQLLRKVGKAVHEFNMIREGDRIAVGVSGGKDSLALLDALLLLQKRSPVAFEVEAFTVEQGKFLAPIAPMQEHMDDRGVRWTYYRDDPSFQLLEEQPSTAATCAAVTAVVLSMTSPHSSVQTSSRSAIRRTTSVSHCCATPCSPAG